MKFQPTIDIRLKNVGTFVSMVSIKFPHKFEVVSTPDKKSSCRQPYWQQTITKKNYLQRVFSRLVKIRK